MEENKKHNSKIDFGQLKKNLLKKKWLFLKVWIITFIISCAWILPQPRYYTAQVSIAPETEESKLGSGGLASLASNFGMNLGGNMNGDAIYPQLYPDLFQSTNFLVGLFNIHITTKDNKIDTDYYTYIKKHQKVSPWMIPLIKLRSLFEDKDKKEKNDEGTQFDPFRLSKESTDVLNAIKGKINCTYSRTTDVVTITVTDQDPLVCALLVDSIKEHLQTFITDYRTKKSRNDYDYFCKMTDEAKNEYEKARREYSAYCDANNGVILQSVKTRIESLENEMSIKYQFYTTMNNQKEAAMAKVQQNTPVFTTIKNATVPIKPAGPKRMIFVAFMLILSTIGTVIYQLRKELKEWF